MRDGVEHIRGGQEQHLGKIERNVEIVILKSVVLFGIEDFQQRGGRIATEIGAELVDLVEDEQWIVRAGVADALNDAARQRPDVGASMSANLGLIANAAQRQPHELAPHRTGDRASE